MPHGNNKFHFFKLISSGVRDLIEGTLNITPKSRNSLSSINNSFTEYSLLLQNSSNYNDKFIHKKTN